MLHPAETVFRVDKGNKAMLTLADGSKVWLNSGSTLTYSEDNVRQVSLEGEAYLKLRKTRNTALRYIRPTVLSEYMELRST